MRFCCLATMIVLALIGCVSAKRAQRVSDRDYAFEVVASQKWQESGVPVRKGNIISLKPEGTWGNQFGSFGPGGNPDIIKTHHLVNAPAFALLMKISCETNRSHIVAGPTNIVATRSGTLQFRSNISINTGVTGSMQVVIATFRDSDGDMLSDEDEINIWKTDPYNTDTDGNGYTDYEDAMHTLERRRIAAERTRGR